jgi:dethiobiotin synthetase
VAGQVRAILSLLSESGLNRTAVRVAVRADSSYRSLADLAGRFGLPLVVVARPGLGTINHTLLTLEAAQHRGLTVAAVVINRYRPGSATLAEETNPEVIARLAKIPIPLIVPFDPGTDPRQGTVGENVLQPLRVFVHRALDSAGQEPR